MEILVAVIAVILVYLLIIAKRKPSSPPNTVQPDEPQTTYTSKILNIFNSDTMTFDQAWRSEPATERQIESLSEIVSEGDISIPPSLTKGQASDAIGLFH